MDERIDDFYEILDTYYSRGRLQAAEYFLLDCIEAAGEAPRRTIAACSELGSLYRGTGRYSLSLEICKKAQKLARETLGTDCAEYATILNNMAGTYRLMKDYENAVASFSEALETYRRAGEGDSYACASVLNNLSLAYRETDQIGKAIECLEQALAIIEPFSEHRQETAITYNNLTELYHQKGDEIRAHFCLTRALQAFEKCPEEERTHYSEVLNSLAGYLYAEGDCEGAVTLYSRSARHTKRFFGESAEYGATLQNMRWVYEKMGEKEKAVAALTTAERVYRSLFGPDHDRTRAVQDDLERLSQ